MKKPEVVIRDLYASDEEACTVARSLAYQFRRPVSVLVSCRPFGLKVMVKGQKGAIEAIEGLMVLKEFGPHETLVMQA